LACIYLSSHSCKNKLLCKIHIHLNLHTAQLLTTKVSLIRNYNSTMSV
jgi:hypothetical protein